MMAANAGVIKAIVSFCRVNSDTVFERHRSRIPIDDLNTVHALKKHLIQFLGLTELTIKYGLGDFDIKLYRMALKPDGKSDNFAITTDDQWKLELPSMEVCILSACVFISCSCVNISMQVTLENPIKSKEQKRKNSSHICSLFSRYTSNILKVNFDKLRV